MDDKHKRIKASVEFNYKRIRCSYDTIKELREECDHPWIDDGSSTVNWLLHNKACVVCGGIRPDILHDNFIQDSDQSINP